MDSFKGSVLFEVVRYLKYRIAHSQEPTLEDFEIDKDLAIEVLLLASYLQIE